MRLLSILLLLISTGVSVSASAADQNGYTARYECRAGGSRCNVDVAALATRACDQIVATSTPWSSINWSHDTICLEAGDHSGKGTLTIPSSASGSASHYKVLRYHRSGSGSEKPWKQAVRAKVKRIVVSGADYWLIDRITIDGDGLSADALLDFSERSGSTHNIANGVLIEDGNANGVRVGSGNSNNTIQNSVIRNCRYKPGYDYSGITHDGGPTNTRTVSNEIYGCNKGIYISEHVAAGTVIENNDLYVPTNMYTDCNGNYNGKGPCAATETQLGTKNGGTQSNPIVILQNRIWGNRATDTVVCCNSGGQGSLVFIGGQGPNTDPDRVGAKYTLFQNNILMDSQQGISAYWSGVRNNSYIGNIVYKINRYNSKYPSFALASGSGDRSEWYLNTVVDTATWDVPKNTYGGNYNDVRCNVAINSGGASGTGTGTQIENNAFFGTDRNSTSSSADDIVNASASGSNATDFCFYRKLQTGPERMCVPYAKPTNTSPHRNACNATIGQRAGVGIGDNVMF